MHRADASSLEISDAAISTTLLLGQTYDTRNKKQFHVNCNSNHSFVSRAALLLTSSRKEAQLQFLMTGSVKNATTSRADELLRPTLTILEYATSRKRENQAIYHRSITQKWDIKSSISYKTEKFDGLMEVKSNQPLGLLGPNTFFYRVRCVAITEYIGLNPEDNTDDSTDLNYDDLFSSEYVRVFGRYSSETDWFGNNRPHAWITVSTYSKTLIPS
eukprot:scaffold5876_cov363-Chaetoceros_neogracile.AAC.2